jgi:CRP/FNR family transcriptional regulator, anaerobic regulatory protein
MSLAVALTGSSQAGASIVKSLGSKATRCETCVARALSICSAMRTESLGRLAVASASRRVRAGEVFLSEGDAASHFFKIIEGAVKVYKLMPDGRRQITGFLAAGDLLGLAINDAYAYNAEALTPAIVCTFPRRQLERLLDEFPQMEKRMLAMASNELAAAQEQMMLLGRKTAHEKIASFLLMRATREERLGRNGGVVRLAMTRTDIADYLGLTTETASRVFTILKRRGWIELKSGNKVVLSDRDALGELATGLE